MLCCSGCGLPIVSAIQLHNWKTKITKNYCIRCANFLLTIEGRSTEEFYSVRVAGPVRH